MSKYDKIFKKNLQKGFLKIVTKFLSMPFDDVLISEKPTELTAKTLRTDFVFQVKRAGKQEIWHIEEQTDDDVNMLERMLKYAGLLYEKYKQPIYQIVLYVGNERKVKSTMVCKQEIGFSVFEYYVINLREIPYQDFLSSAETLPFSILGSFGEKSLEEVLSDIGKSADSFLKAEEEVLNFASDLIVLSERRNLDKQVSGLISKVMSILTDYRRTYPFQQGVLEGRQEGEQIGLQKGKQEGKQEGEQMAQYRAIRNMLMKGNFSYEQIADILEVDVTWVREIAEQLRK